MSRELFDLLTRQKQKDYKMTESDVRELFFRQIKMLTLHGKNYYAM